MKFQCSFCKAVFASTKPPTECPLCQGRGKARYGKNKMPAKRLTARQKRQIAALDPELVKAFREAQAAAVAIPEGAQVKVVVVPDQSEGKTQSVDPMLIEASCTIKLT